MTAKSIVQAGIVVILVYGLSAVIGNFYCDVEWGDIPEVIDASGEGSPDEETITGVCDKCNLIQPWADVSKIEYCPGHAEPDANDPNLSAQIREYWAGMEAQHGDVHDVYIDVNDTWSDSSSVVQALHKNRENIRELQEIVNKHVLKPLDDANYLDNTLTWFTDDVNMVEIE